jgi:hypothetical protein
MNRATALNGVHEDKTNKEQIDKHHSTFPRNPENNQFSEASGARNSGAKVVRGESSKNIPRTVSG